MAVRALAVLGEWRWGEGGRGDRFFPASLTRVQHPAITCLEVLPLSPPCTAGENEAVRLALRAPAINGRGLRILSLDGGGMRGLVTVRLGAGART